MKRLLVAVVALMLLICTLAQAEVSDSGDLPLPIGNPNPASEWLFTGQSYILNLVDRDDVWNADGMMNVTFEPCCRTD